MSEAGAGARALHAALTALQAGDLERAHPAGLSALEAFGAEGDRTGTAAAHQVLAITSLGRGELDAALSHVDAAIPLRESTGDLEGLASLWQERLELCLRMGNLAGARESAERQVEVWRNTSEKEGFAHALHQLAHLLLQSGDDGRAEAMVNDALYTLDPTTQPRARAALHLLYSSIWVSRQDGERAVAQARQGLEMARAARNRRAEIDAIQQCGVAHASAGEMAPARRALEEALVGRELLKDLEGRANVLQELAAVERALGENKSALDRLRYAAKTLREADNLLGEIAVLQVLVETAEAVEEPEVAVEGAHLMAEAAARTGDREAEAGAQFMLATRLAGSGHLPAAANAFRTAGEIQEILGLTHESAVSRGMLGQVLIAMGNAEEGRTELVGSLARLDAMGSEAAATVREVLAELDRKDAEA